MSAAEDLKFPYQALRDPGDSFRLLDLLPDCGDQVIRCNLRHTALSSLPHYCALSYTWGPDPSNADAHIELNGRLVAIRKNLLAFLTVLRSPHTTRTLWADAVCIDQANIEERNQQVSIMGQLYREADEVLAWLGEADDSGKLLNYMSINNGEILNNDTAMISRYVSLFGDADSLYFWSALAAVFRREYWTRLWIIQEILLAREITVYCGDQWLNLRKLWGICHGALTSMLPTKSQEQQQQVLHEHKAATDRSMWRRIDRHRSLSQQVGLEQLVRNYGNAACQDVRDWIYGLLGLAVDGTGFHVDYAERAERLFFRFMAFCHSENPIAFGRELQSMLQVGSEGLKSELVRMTLSRQPIETSLVASFWLVDMHYVGTIEQILPRARWQTTAAADVDLSLSAFCILPASSGSPLALSSRKYSLPSKLEWRCEISYCFTSMPAQPGDSLYSFSSFLTSSATVLIFRDMNLARRRWMLPKLSRPKCFVGRGVVLDLPALKTAAQHALNTIGPEPFQAFRSEAIKLPKKSKNARVQVSWLDLLLLVATPGRTFSEDNLRGKGEPGGFEWPGMVY